MIDVIARPPATERGGAIVTVADHLHGPDWDGARASGWGTVRLVHREGPTGFADHLSETLTGLEWFDGRFALAGTDRECPRLFDLADTLGALAVVAFFPVPGSVRPDVRCPALVLDAAYRDDAPSSDSGSSVIHGPWAHPAAHTLLPECVLGIPDHLLADAGALAAHWLERGCRGPLPQFFHGVQEWSIASRASRRVLDLDVGAGELRHRAIDPFPAVPQSAPLPDDRDDVVRSTVTDPVDWSGPARLVVEVDATAGQLVGTLGCRRADGVCSIVTDAIGDIAPNGECELTFGAAAFSPGRGDVLVVEVTATRAPRHPNPPDTSLRVRSARLELPEVRRRAPEDWPVSVIGPTPSGDGATLATADALDPSEVGDERLGRLVDARSGLVTSITPAPAWVGLPDGAHLVSAQVASLDDLLPWPADRIAMGMGFDEDTAFDAAVGEAIERYCGNFVPSGLHRASWDELDAGDVRAIDPADVALFAPEQHASTATRFEPLTRQLRIDWVEGTDLTDGGSTLVPASLVWVNHHLDRDEPRTHPHNLAGLAAGRDLRDAERSALEEIIERDAVQIWWLSGIPASGIDHDPALLDDELGAEGDGWFHHARLPYRIRSLAIPTTWPVPVVGVYLHHLHHDLHVLGLAARPDPRDAVRKAWLEALALQGYARGLLDPDGDVWRSVETGVFAGHGLKPWRADRRYRSDYADDFSDVVDLACHSQIWLDPAMRSELGPILSTERPSIAIDRLERSIGHPHAHYVQAMADVGIRPVSVDVTTPDVAFVGPRACRVVAPGTYMNTPAGFPLLGGHRLADDAAALGRAGPVTVDTVNLAPLPHT